MEGLNILNPRAQIVPELVKSLIKPDNIGDLHLKMMIKYPDQFAIRKEIIEMFMSTFYKILWNKETDLANKLELEVLMDDHQESAFVEVRSEDVKHL
jgi:Glu-tRNA(Gln) amidotransferase subunit E-like FAD-binding protein